jgi:hypothetical protein
MTTGKCVARVLALSVALGALAGSVQAQDADDRWLPFLGCWEPVDVEEGSGLLCFSAADGGVQMTNVAAADIVSSELMVADGQPRAVTVDDCDAQESVVFSDDGLRAFTRSQFVCGDEPASSGTGVMTFTGANRWADVRSLNVDGQAEPVAWVQVYRLASLERLAEEGMMDQAQGRDMAIIAARMAASAPIELADVEEAAAMIDAKAVETWVAAKGDPLHVDAGDLVRLADSGMPEDLIDVVVAVSHPERFRVAAAGPVEAMDGGQGPDYRGPRGYMGYNPFWGPSYGYGGYGFGYSPFGYGYGRASGIGGYGSYYGSYYGGYYGYTPATVVIDRAPRNNGGRMVNGQGYTRGGSSGSRTANPRGSSAGASSSGSSGTASGSSGSSGSRSGSGRTAKRRRGG